MKNNNDVHIGGMYELPVAHDYVWDTEHKIFELAAYSPFVLLDMDCVVIENRTSDYRKCKVLTADGRIVFFAYNIRCLLQAGCTS